ncbi:tetratricopeptide repeat protein [Paracoccus sp. MC1854]|uniref:tetratricopeptide repeat protein n=1 Tax=Paracoccus sp. MC1854 TaxID=2760306 RepID=UPI0016003096|nr:tetratricopeptide repeat protein [Paracoccus sp. MC1854]MBB1492641.1 tetratricopeptide repeat protein [Paracoccus sp. MC1854]
MTHDALSGCRPRRPFRPLLSGAMILGLCLTLTACKSSAEKAAEYYESALQLLEQGDPDRAILQLRNVFNIDGTHYEARRKLAELLVQQDKPGEAYSQYLRLAEQYPDDLEVRLALAELAFDSQQSDELERHAIRAIEIAPDDPRAKALDLARRYNAAVQGNDMATGNSLVPQAEALLAELPDNHMLLAILLDKAARDRQLDKAEALIDRLIALKPDNPLHYRQRLALLVEKGDMSGVEEQLRRMIAQFPDDPQYKGDLVGFYMTRNEPAKAEAYLRELAAAAPAGDPGPMLDVIRFVEEEKGPEAARAELEKVLAAGGDPLVFGVLRAGFDFREGRQSEAIAEIERLLEGAAASDRTRDIKVQLARMLSETGNEVAARQRVEEVLAEDASHPGALKMRAAWAIRASDTDAAVSALRTVLDHKADDVEALTLLSEAYQRAGEKDLARDLLAQAASASGNAPGPSLRLAQLLLQEERYRPAEDALIPALRLAPGDIDLLAALGEVYVRMPDDLRARDVIRSLRDIGTEPAVAAANRIEVARLARAEGNDAALAYLEELAGAADAGLTEKLPLIQARLVSGDTAGALQLAQELAAAQPEERSVKMILAMVQQAGGDAAAARAIYRDLIAADPQDVQAHMSLVRLEAAQGDAAAATAAVDQGLAANPDNPDLLWARAGQLEAAGDIDGAIAVYERLHQANPDSVLLANNLASLLATYRADQPESLARATAVARWLNGTTVPAFMDTYGWILHLNGESAAALPYLEGAAEALADDPAVQVHLGLVQEATGKTQAALEQLRHALTIEGGDPDSPPRQAARAAIARLEAAPAPAGEGEDSATTAGGTTATAPAQ